MRKHGTMAIALFAGLLLGVSTVSALDVSNIQIIQGCDRTDGVVTDWFFEVRIMGTDLNDGVFWNSNLSGSGNEWKAFSVDGPDLVFNANYVSQAALEAVHAPGNSYRIYLNKTIPAPTSTDYEDNVTLSFAAMKPTAFANITSPLHNQTGVGLNPTMQWDSVAGAAAVEALGMFIYNVDTGMDEYGDAPVTDTTMTSWTPGPLQANTNYEFEIATANMVGNDNQILTMVGSGTDQFEVLRAYVDVNIIAFDTFSEIPEPMSLLLVGTAVIGMVGLRRRRRMA